MLGREGRAASAALLPLTPETIAGVLPRGTPWLDEAEIVDDHLREAPGVHRLRQVLVGFEVAIAMTCSSAGGYSSAASTA